MRLLLLLLLAAPLAAQPVTPEASCSYTDCALRVELGFIVGPELVRGEPGNEVVVGRVGVLMDGLGDAVAASPQALGHAGSARRARIGALAATIAGSALALYSAVEIDDGGSDRYLAYFYTGLALGVAGGVLERRAQLELSRAVWEYNRTVVDG